MWLAVFVASLATLVIAAGMIVGAAFQKRIRQQEEEARQLAKEVQVTKEQAEVKVEEVERAKKEAEIRAASYEEEQTATWADDVLFSDDFDREEVGEDWRLEGDVGGWKIEDGALAYFGKKGSIAWIGEEVTGDFRLELDVSLPAWDDTMLEEAVILGMSEIQIPMMPGGGRISPTRQQWEGLHLMRSADGRPRGVPVGKNMLALATYLQVDLQELSI